jgi:hypothetical protein
LLSIIQSPNKHQKIKLRQAVPACCPDPSQHVINSQFCRRIFQSICEYSYFVLGKFSSQDDFLNSKH